MHEQEWEISGGGSLCAPAAFSAKLPAAEKRLFCALSQVEGKKRGQRIQREGGRSWESCLVVRLRALFNSALCCCLQGAEDTDSGTGTLKPVMVSTSMCAHHCHFWANAGVPNFMPLQGASARMCAAVAGDVVCMSTLHHLPVREGERAGVERA
jgi:hypothetical protein